MQTVLLGWSVLVLCLAAPVQAEVLLVGPGGHESIQAAVDAADDGDTIVVSPGAHSAFVVDGKGLTIVAEGGTADVEGFITVRNTSPGQAILMQGVRAGWLQVLGCEGPARFADCEFKGAWGWDVGAATVLDSSDVSFVRCWLEGGDSPFADGFGCGCVYSSPGGAGLLVERGVASVFDCQLVGGDAGGAEGYAGPGGSGCSVTDGILFAEGSEFRGGNGGQGWQEGGDGGHGLFASSVSRVLLRNTLASAGQEGSGDLAGEAGQAYLLQGELTSFHAPTSFVSVTSPVRENAPATVVARGEPGALVIVALSQHDGVLPAPGYSGWLFVGPAFQLVPLGVIPGTSTLAGHFVAPPLPPGVDTVGLRLQGVTLDPLGDVSLTNWTPLVILPAGP